MFQHVVAELNLKYPKNNIFYLQQKTLDESFLGFCNSHKTLALV